jgi:hypothetical protein
MSKNFENFEVEAGLRDELATVKGKDDKELLLMKMQRAALKQQINDSSIGTKLKNIAFNPITIGLGAAALGAGIGAAANGSTWYENLVPSASGSGYLGTSVGFGTAGILGGVVLSGKKNHAYAEKKIAKLDKKIRLKQAAIDAENGEIPDDAVTAGSEPARQNPAPAPISKRKKKTKGNLEL